MLKTVVFSINFATYFLILNANITIETQNGSFGVKYILLILVMLSIALEKYTG